MPQRPWRTRWRRSAERAVFPLLQEKASHFLDGCESRHRIDAVKRGRFCVAPKHGASGDAGILRGFDIARFIAYEDGFSRRLSATPENALDPSRFAEQRRTAFELIDRACEIRAENPANGRF